MSGLIIAKKSEHPYTISGLCLYQRWPPTLPRETHFGVFQKGIFERAMYLILILLHIPFCSQQMAQITRRVVY